LVRWIDRLYVLFVMKDSGSLALFPASGIEGASTNEAGSGGSPLNQRWSAREEIRLLDAIEQYGFGNWFDTSRHIESKLPSGNF